MATDLLRSLFGGGGPTGGGDRGSQWLCGKCGGLPNDLSRKKCRRCGGTRASCESRSTGGKGNGRGSKGGSGGGGGGPPPQTKAGPQAGGGPASPGGGGPAPAGPEVTSPAPRQWPARPPAPEARAAAAARKADALTAAAATLREAGLTSEADALGKPAAQLQKAVAEPKPGARLDACAAFVERASKRLTAAQEEVAAAEEALAAARDRVASLEQELSEGRHRLEELRVAADQPTGGDFWAEMALKGDVLKLLDALESSPVPGSPGTGPALPEAVLGAMTALRDRLRAPPDGRSLDERLGDALELEQRPPGEGQAGGFIEADEHDDLASAMLGESGATEMDEAMAELDSAESGDEAALVQAAKRLRRTSRFKLLTKTKGKAS